MTASTRRVLIALVTALAGGAAIAATGNATLLAAADAVAPLGQIWVNAVRMTVIPLIVPLIIVGVAGAANLRTLGRLGARTVLTFAVMIAALAAVMMPLITLAYAALPQLTARPPLPPGASEAASRIAASHQPVGIVPWFVALLPANPIGAAAEGNMVSLLVFTLLLGVAVARSPEASRETLLGVCRAMADAMLVLVRWVVAVAPAGIFGLMLPLAAHGGAGVAGAVGVYIVMYCAASLVGVLLVYPAVALLGGVSMGAFARAALPPQLIAFSTSSSVAALPSLVEASAALKLPPAATGFVLPLAIAIFKFAGPVSWTTGVLFVARFYGLPIDLTGLLTIAFAAVFLAFAAPGVPSGAFLTLTPLLLAVGLPAEGIGILLAADALPDLFATVLNVTGDLAAAVLVAKGTDAKD